MFYLAVFAGLAIVAGALALVTSGALPRAERPVSLRAASMTIVVGMLALGGIGSWVWARTPDRPPAWTPDRQQEIERAGNTVIDSLLAFHDRTGRYPTALNELGLASPPTPYGPIEYSVTRDSAGVERATLAVGDYKRDRFHTYWTSSRARWDWYLDR